MNPIPFALVGGGWRAEFYLRVAAACPDRFRLTGLVVRNAEKGAALTEQWNVPTFRTLEELLDGESPRFVVTSVPWAANPEVVLALVQRGVPVLSETPPAPDVETMRTLYAAVQERNGLVQVAEQYHLQPMHQARLRVAAGGKLGTVSQAQVSVAHGYHGISLMRRFLRIAWEPATVRAFAFDSPVVDGPGREGPPTEERIVNARQALVLFDFGDRLGVFDFTSQQYFNWVRGNRLLVRGDRGEMTLDRVVYLQDYATPVELTFVRHVAGADGNLEGLFLRGVQLGETWLYRNPFAPASLTDDELAVAECLVRMDRYLDTGMPFYSLAEACHDHYLNLVAAEALKQDRPLHTEPQPWNEDLEGDVWRRQE